MRTDVSFPSNDITVAAHLYSPDIPTGRRRPAVVVGHPTTGVKEQTAALYAQRLADRGYVTLAFDAAYQGESGGEPHGLEDPQQRSDDFRAAVDFLTGRDDVDPDGIGVLGICGSGSYVVHAAQSDERMRAVATVSAADVPSFLRAGDPEGFDELVGEADEHRREEAAGEPARTTSVLPDSVDDSTPAPIREFYEYYRTDRAWHPRATNLIVTRSVAPLSTFDAWEKVGTIAPRPLLMIAGTEAMTLPVSRDSVERAGDNAELYLVEGATHVDLYDRDEPVRTAVTQLDEFFGRHLAST